MLRKLVAYLKAHLDSLLSISVRIGGVGLGFLITLFIGRQLGPEALGQYGIITQSGMFLSLIAVGGLDLSIVRSFSEAHAAKRLPKTVSLIKVLVGVAAVLMALSFATYLFEDLIKEELLENSAVPFAVGILLLIAITRSLTRLTSNLLRSQNIFVFSGMIEVLIIPAITLVFLLSQPNGALVEILWVTVAGGFFAALVGTFWSFAKTSSSSDAVDIPMRPLVKRAVPLWGVAVSKNMSDWYSLAVVAAVLSLYETGIFRVAMQIASALPVITVGLFSVFASKFSVAHTRNDFPEIARLARSATVLSIVLVVPPGLFAIVFAEPILGIVGPEFANEQRILQVLLIGQILYVCTGPSGLVLAMTGNEKVNLVLTVASLVALLVLLPLAAEHVGLMGLVLVMSAILVIRNIASLLAVRRLTGVSILTGRYHPLRNR